MESDRHHLHYHHHDHRQKQANSGLDVTGTVAGGDEFFNRPPSPETERIFEQFLQSTEELRQQMESQTEEAEKPLPPRPASLAASQSSPRERRSSYHGFYQQQLHKQDQDPNPGSFIGYGPAQISGVEPLPPIVKVDGVSNLIRHSSSPAGMFNDVQIENSVVVMRGRGDFGGYNSNREASFASKPPPSPSRLMTATPEMRNQTSFFSSRGDSSTMSDNGLTSGCRTLSGGLNLRGTKMGKQNIEVENKPSCLSNHPEMSEIEKILELSDFVPFKIRAKRGCATHPRSIAERVRRTKISERMKKVQDLVPNMDKQASTADMLDLAVDYIKDLQERIKILKEVRERCTCSNL